MYRTNAQSRALEEQFIRTGTPYVVVGSKKFYERKEIKDVLAYLRLIANPRDAISLQRIINVPVRKIGPKTIAEFMSWAEEKELPPLDALARIEEHPTLATAGKRALENFYQLMVSLRQTALEEKLPYLIDRLLEQSGYSRELRDGSDEGEERWNNVLELRRVAEDFSEIDPETALELFLENVALVAGADTTQSGEDGQIVQSDEKDAVTLITLHAAKGLEFPVVFLVGLEEGVLPHARSLENQQELEEERRLAYVGITRAMNRLYLTHAIRRSFFGGSAVYQEASRFIEEIPDELLTHTRHLHQADRKNSYLGEIGRGSTGGGDRERGIWGSPAPTPYRHGNSWTAHASGRTGSRFTPADGTGTKRPMILPDHEPTGEPFQPQLTQNDEVAAESSSADLVPGDRVMHRLFGEGTVLKVTTERGGTSIEVLFKSSGKKTLDPNFARLEKV
jgi:DNA helicase-2/ATP-dependent DNA helicase PcrA